MQKSLLQRSSQQLAKRTNLNAQAGPSPSRSLCNKSTSISRPTFISYPTYVYCNITSSSSIRNCARDGICVRRNNQWKPSASGGIQCFSSSNTDMIDTNKEDRDEMMVSSSLQEEQMLQNDVPILDINNDKGYEIHDSSSSKSSSSSSSLLSLLNEDDTSIASAADASDTLPSTSTKKKKKKVKKRMKQPKPSNLIPKINIPTQQSKVNAQVLFDYIAPHVEKELLLHLLERMKELEHAMEVELIREEKEGSKAKSKSKSSKKFITNKELKEYQTLIGRVDSLFKAKSKKKRGGGRKGDSQVDTLEKLPWIKSLIAQFFAGSVEDEVEGGERAGSNGSPTTSGNAVVKENMPVPLSMDLLWRDPTFTPNINRMKRSETVSTLMQAREMSLESPLLWSNNQRRKFKKKKGEEAWENEKRDEHFQKTAAMMKEEAEAMASLLSFRLPANAHDDLVALLQLYADNVADKIVAPDSDVRLEDDTDECESDHEGSESDEDSHDDNSKPHVEIMKMIFLNLKRRTGFHVHLVAMEIANFLYVDLPQQTGSDTSSVDLSDDIDGLPSIPLGRSDARINESWNDWNSLRGDLVSVFLSSQHMYVRLQSAVKKGESDRLEKEKKKDITKNEPKEDEVEKIMIKYTNDANKRTDELVAELDRLRTTEDGEMVGSSPAERQRVGRAPKAVHLRYECLMLNENFGPYSNAETAYLVDGDDSFDKGSISPDICTVLPDTNKTMFVDNLPIDVTREELEYLYSRCGEIESIEIFNLRPDLDPGELSNKKMMERKKKNRLSGMKGATKIRNHRSPVYAAIKFVETKGCDSATIDMLRIFGMVIRRHAVKSHPARNIHKIYIEGIPQGRFAMDFEEKLSTLLTPNMYISLVLGQHVNAQAKSCEIAFPTFEVANYAYQQLQNFNTSNEDEKCSIHWMKTPDNAMAYWTRDLSPNNN